MTTGLLGNRQALAALVALVLLTLAVAAAPLLAQLLGTGPNEVDLLARFAGPSLAHPLGTDELGRDVALRLLYGGRVSLTVGLGAALLAAVIGTAVGLVAGYRGGTVDALLMRLTDGVIALPLLPLLIVLAAVDPAKVPGLAALTAGGHADLWRIVLIVVLVGWTTVARLVRGAAISLRARDYVRAAESYGAGALRVMLVHILPGVATPIVVATTLAIGDVILFESVLSFLGLGIQPPTPSWGNMLTNAQELIYDAPALAIWPGALIFVTVIACNFLGDGIQAALDPRARRA